MPELPEVETVRQGLLSCLNLSQQPRSVLALEVRQPRLRRSVPADLSQKVCGKAIYDIQRRAKYLLWQCDEGVIINHLGMTGSWRLHDGSPLAAHDHLRIHLDQGQSLVYRDPRRFGLIAWCRAEELASHPLLAHLGPEPLSADFDANYLRAALKRRAGPIKAAIMDQKVVVGVGNIYAAEALFRAGIKPLSAANTVSSKRLQRLHQAIVAVLGAAITAGGSTIKDFRQAGGSSGYFQHQFQVYGRQGSPCQVCSSTLLGQVIAGRASCWCPKCQR